ncbi:hypothetical protein D8B26_002525 [Coccidioides posadasii str. Silveira]|uniref:C6 finger domain transcription factor nscR n=1 Tax=Coccidioides posadasii (strain RMSCC 757 / Silveira) TaxID=443226 RepID=E9DH69_COCPS|nr:C6 transcription factor [Coccidioides posadasii str. Silveira]QVM07834.1 hypothetical protein D8B26_002525 [Coccidioides posadasii str. Silveira]
MEHFLDGFPPPAAEALSMSANSTPVIRAGGDGPLCPPAPQSATSTPKAPARRKHYTISSGKPITRTRVSYSCHTCRRRKVKCDKVHPMCGNCLKNGSECVYDSRSLLQQNRSSQDHHSRVKRRREPPKPAEASLAEILSPYAGVQGSLGLGEQKSGSGEIAARLDRLTSMIERLSRTNAPLTPQESDPLFQGVRSLYQASEQSPTDVRRYGIAASSASSRSQSRQPSPRRLSDSGSNEDFPIPAGLSTDLVDPVGTLNLGHLSLEDGGKSRYVGTTYWAYISDEINELNQLLRDQNRSQQQPLTSPDSVRDIGNVHIPPLSTHYDAQSGPRRFSSKEEPRGTGLVARGDSPLPSDRPIEADMLDYVPSRRQSNILYKGFMSGIHAISPVVHPPTVLGLYQCFWEWYDSRDHKKSPFPDPSFIPLLYAIWYGGSVTISLRTIHAEFDVDNRAELSEPFHDEVTRWLKKISFPRSATLHGLAAFLLVQTILSKEEEPLTSSLFISLALRVAQTMGLHRDPAQFGIPPCEAENRRRLWWHIVHMDGVVAMSSGLPPLVSDENYWDVRIASDVKDTLIGSPEAVEYERLVSENRRKPDRPNDPNVCGNSMVNVYYICARGKYVMARAIRKVLRIQLGTKPVTRKDMEDLRSILMDLQTDLHALVDRIPIPKLVSKRNTNPKSLAGLATLKPDLPNGGPGCHEQYHSSVLAAFHKWARILLSLFVDKAFCVAYQPFLKNARSKIWPAARQCALRHCHGFMEKFIALATDPDFQPFQWSWPGNHQPMHATMIMLIDLYERPNTPEAPISRAFIDKIFSLSGPDGGVVGGEDGISTARPLKDGGREAWDMMRRLREKAWQKAGLNPKVLWTEHAQAQAAISQDLSSKNSSTPSRPATSGAKDHISPPANFADSYYAMIKEPYENHQPSQRISAEREKLTGSPKTSTARTSNDESRHTHAIWPTHTPDSNPGPHLSPTSAAWDSSQSMSGMKAFNPGYGQPHSRKSSETARFMDTSNGYNHHHNSPNQPGRDSSSTKSSSESHTISPFTPSAAGHLRTQALDPNVNFDWDQWDAVFGQYLPVVDGFMDVDNIANHNQNQMQCNEIALNQVPMMGVELSFDNEAHDGEELRNWADFG